jgi:hypothetical protein
MIVRRTGRTLGCVLAAVWLVACSGEDVAQTASGQGGSAGSRADASSSGAGSQNNAGNAAGSNVQGGNGGESSDAAADGSFEASTGEAAPDVVIADVGTNGGDGAGTGTDGATEAGADGGCPSPVAGTLFVAPTGSDTTGNGSAVCPYVTITKALSQTVAAAAPTTIVVQSGTLASPFIYGNGCTAGAGKCDATPIRVTDGMNHGIVIQGSSSDAAALKIVGGSAATDTAVVTVNAPNVGFQNLTIQPVRLASFNGSRVAGAAGICFAAPASATTEASVTNVVISGVTWSNVTEATGSGIEISDGTSPSIGPGVTIIGGDQSVLVTQAVTGAPAVASHPVITSSMVAPSMFQQGQFACVRVESTNVAATAMPTAVLSSTSATDPGRLHLRDCGGNGGAVSVDTIKAGTAVDVTNVLIDTSGAAVTAFYGMRLINHGVLKSGAGVTVTGINEVRGAGAAIEAVGQSTLTIVPGTTLTQNVSNGLHVGGVAAANVNGLVAMTSRNGLLCDQLLGGLPKLVLRNSTFLQNRNQGALIGPPCVADLGSGLSAGNNTFNKTAQANAHLGLCYNASTPATVTSSTWGCGLSTSSACTPATGTTPAPIVAGCDQVGDHNDSASLTVALPQTCCGL